MNNTCIILLLFVTFTTCALSSYLDIPPPPERPARFKTKEQIETYLKAVKDYYDAFKIKLVRREDFLQDDVDDDEDSLIDVDDLNQSPRRRNRIHRLFNQHH